MLLLRALILVKSLIVPDENFHQVKLLFHQMALDISLCRIIVYWLQQNWIFWYSRAMRQRRIKLPTKHIVLHSQRPRCVLGLLVLWKKIAKNPGAIGYHENVSNKIMKMCHRCLIPDNQFYFKQSLGLFTVWFYTANRSGIQENWNFKNRMCSSPTTQKCCCNIWTDKEKDTAGIFIFSIFKLYDNNNLFISWSRD